MDESREELCICLTAMMECRADPPHTTHPSHMYQDGLSHLSFPLYLTFPLSPPLHNPSICFTRLRRFPVSLFNQLLSFLTHECNGSFCFCRHLADRMNINDFLYHCSDLVLSHIKAELFMLSML